MRKKIEQAWNSQTIRHKILLFTGGVLLIIVLSCILDAWIVRFSMVDFHRILEMNAQNGELVRVIERENAAFEAYVKNADEEKQETLKQAMEATRETVEQYSVEDRMLGVRIYAQIWSIRNIYEVYQESRDAVLAMDSDDPRYIESLYEVYDMQSYLFDYAQTLLIESAEAGNAVYRETYPLVLWVTALVILLILLSFFAVLWLSQTMYRSIVYPVIALAEASRKIAANEFFIEDVQVENQDELGELVAAFNKMKYATARYIQTQEENRIALGKLHEKELEQMELERRLENARMEVLINQINPHFLFNTLNVIGGMANLEEAEITEKMIKALSDIFRYNLKNDEQRVSLAREIKVTQDYMYLQHMRFGARISYRIDCRVDTQKYQIPTFTFQPLVENAIIHGLAPKVEGGKIKISVWEKGGSLLIIVADNGVGMPEETRDRLRAEILQNSKKEMGIGFTNVSRRILAMYPEARVGLFSREKRGTIVKIEIPIGGE
nr:sensor histidine kinase [uncultured Marvinbryantia sp.]